MTASLLVRNISSATLLAALLAGCATVGHDYNGAPEAAPQAAGRSAFVRAGDGVVATAPAARWWKSLGDPVLDQLVEAAFIDSPGIAAANARIAQSRAALAANRTAALPTVNTSFAAPYLNVPGNIAGNGGGRDEINAYNLGFDASWEIDLFGGTRRKIEAASARAEAAEAGAADARVTLSAEIARAYVGLRARQAMLGLQDRQIEIDRELVSLARQRFAAGTTPQQPLNSAEAQAFASEAEVARSRAEIAVLMDQIAVLTGKEPGALDTLLATPGAVPLPPAQIAVADPATLLRSRPDIRMAERQLAAANADIGAKIADKFPKISFLGLLGLGGQNIGDVFDPANIVGIALPQIKWNLFDGGRANRQIDSAKGAYAEAEATYRQTVLAALQDAEASLSRFGAQRVAFGKALDAEDRARKNVNLQQQRLQAGTIGKSDSLTAERQALQLAMASASSRAELTSGFIAVEKALGLGWSVEQTGSDPDK
ncbi:MAG: efflux transporter outer membrane subunit [Novosphingobium sp.]